jgi:lysozyme
MKSSELMADVSSNNGWISVDNYARAGHVVLAVKATQGQGYTNPYHYDQCNRAHEFGLTVVHYHYCDNTSIQGQINHFRNIYNRAWRNGDYACFDIEEPNLYTAFANSILSNYFAQAQHEPILYTYRADFEEKLRGVKVPGGRLWIADYSSNVVHVPKSYTLWARQYTDGKEGPEPHFYSGIGKCDGSYVSAGIAKALYLRKIKTRKRK